VCVCVCVCVCVWRIGGWLLRYDSCVGDDRGGYGGYGCVRCSAVRLPFWTGGKVNRRGY
jgi:hypothetical protein